MKKKISIIMVVLLVCFVSVISLATIINISEPAQRQYADRKYEPKNILPSDDRPNG